MFFRILQEGASYISRMGGPSLALCKYIPEGFSKDGDYIFRVALSSSTSSPDNNVRDELFILENKTKPKVIIIRSMSNDGSDDSFGHFRSGVGVSEYGLRGGGSDVDF